MHDTIEADIAADAFKTGMRRLASGVALVTGSDGGNPVGLVATAVCSVCVEPPTLLVCVNKNATAHDALDSSGVMCVNLLSTQDRHLANVFSQTSQRHNRFKTGVWQILATGAPVLSSSIAAFDCAIVERVSRGTHTIFLGEVRRVHVADGETDPLLYLNSAFRRLDQYT